MQVTLSKEKLVEYYNTCNASGKKNLEKLYGSETFDTEANDPWIKFCKAQNIDPINSLPYPAPADSDEASQNAYHKLIKMIRVTTKNWVPDWNDIRQYKYYPWFNMQSGFGFSFSNYGYAITATDVGSRLCFPTREMCISFAKENLSIYKEYLTL